MFDLLSIENNPRILLKTGNEAIVRIIGHFPPGFPGPAMEEWMVGPSSVCKDRHGCDVAFHGNGAFCFYQGDGDDVAGLCSF